MPLGINQKYSITHKLKPYLRLKTAAILELRENEYASLVVKVESNPLFEKMLKEYGHTPIPVHPAGHTVDGTPGLKSLDDIHEPVDTVTMYVGPDISNGEFDRILRLKPRRVIFNPGSENEPLAERLEAAGMEVVRACTLVMLRTEQF